MILDLFVFEHSVRVHLNMHLSICICLLSLSLVYQEFSRRGNPAAEKDYLWVVFATSVSLLSTLGRQREAELLVFAVSWQLCKSLEMTPLCSSIKPHFGALSTVLESFLPDYALSASVYV